MKRSWLLLGLSAAWGVALTLGLHSGSALVVDSRTGAKYCVSTLAGFIGLPQGSPLEPMIQLTAGVLTLALPFVILGMILVPIFLRWRARILSRGLTTRYARLFSRLY